MHDEIVLALKIWCNVRPNTWCSVRPTPGAVCGANTNLVQCLLQCSSLHVDEGAGGKQGAGMG